MYCSMSRVLAGWPVLAELTPYAGALAPQLQVRWRWHKDKLENRWGVCHVGRMACTNILSLLYELSVYYIRRTYYLARQLPQISE